MFTPRLEYFAPDVGNWQSKTKPLFIFFPLEVANDASKNIVLISLGGNPGYRARVDCPAVAGRSSRGF
jgi:hypothetical protein